MAYYMAKVDVLIEAKSEAEACDALAEGMRPMLQTFNTQSSWIDWRYSTELNYPKLHNGEGFEYSDYEADNYECANCGAGDHPSSECPHGGHG